MALLGKITVYVLFLGLFLPRNNWYKYPNLIAIALLTLPAAPSASGSLLENVEQVKKYESYFKMLGEIAQSTRDTSAMRNQYWRVHIVRSRTDSREYMLIDSELSSTPIGSPLMGSPVLPDNPEAHPFSMSNPFPEGSLQFTSWHIDYDNEALVTGPPFQRVDLSTFKQLPAGGNPFTFRPDEETLLSVRMRVQNRKSGDPQPKQRTFILVPNHDVPTAETMFDSKNKLKQTFFCHYINSQNSTCEVCVEFETLEDEKSIHDLRTASHFYDQSSVFNNPVEKQLSGTSAYPVTDDDYQKFLEVFEQNIQGEFLNVQDCISVDVSSEYESIGQAHARVIGRGQFSVVFTLDNVLPGLALRRFPGYINRRDADNFLLTHEAALKLYRELGVNLEPTRLLRIRAGEGYSIYMIQRHLRKDQLAENFIEGLLDFGPDEIAMSIKSQDSTEEVHEMSYAEAVSRILHAVIAAIYNNLEKLGNENSAHRICCDAKPDNFAVSFAYRKEWKRRNLYLRDVVTHADLTDFHPCSLVLFDQLLFDGGPEAAMLSKILGYNPYRVYQEKIKSWADAKKLIIKSLANIAYHAGDMAYDIMPELIDRTRLMLVDEWQSTPELRRRYMDYLYQRPVSSTDASKLPLERLFFDPDEISAESVIQYRNDSSRNNLKLKLHHYLLKLAREMRPEQFHHQLYLPVDYQQDWWLRIVDKKYREAFSKALARRFSELDANEANGSEPTVVASESLRTLVNSVAANRTLVDEAKLSRLINWHVVAGKIPEHANEQRKKHERTLRRIERDYLIRRVNRFYSNRLQSLHMTTGPDSAVAELFDEHPAEANEIIEESLKAFKNGFSKLQQLFWLHLVNQHQPPLPEDEQQQFDKITKDEWIQQVNQKYSDKIRTALNRAFGQKSFEDKIRLLANNSMLEILIREILSDTGIPLFSGEKASATGQQPEDRPLDETDFAALPATRLKKNSTSFSQQSTHIELTQPTADSQLLSTGYSFGTLTRKSLTELMKKWGIYPMDIVQAEATTFPEAYSRLRSQNWARALENLNLLFPVSVVYPLPETVRLRFKPRVYERQFLARELRLIPSHDKVQFPSYTHRDTLIQAIKEVMGHRTPSRESKPLVIIDLSSSVDEMITDTAHHSTPPPSPPRIIVIQSILSRAGARELRQVKQVTVPLAHLNQWIRENRKYDYLLRILRVQNDDQWFTLKLPESVKTKKDKKAKRSAYAVRQAIQWQSSTPPTLQPSRTKRIKLENLSLNPREQMELMQQGITELSQAELTRYRAHQAAVQAKLHQAEEQALNALKSQWCQVHSVAADHFCLYNSLVHLLNMRPESAGKLIDHIISLLKKLVLTMPYANHGVHGYIVGGLFRNIIFLALKNDATRNNLSFQLRNQLANGNPWLKSLLKRLLRKLPRHLPVDYNHILNNLDHMDIDSQWSLLNQLIINAGNSTAFDLLLADLINQLAVLAGQTQHEYLIHDLVQQLSQQSHQDSLVLTPHMLFLGLGAQALNHLMNNPSLAGFQMLEGLMPFQPGQHMWGDSNVVEHLLMPLLQAANTALNVMIVTPAIHNPQEPLGAMLIAATAGNPDLEVMPVPSHDQLQIMQWLNDPDTLTLFHGGLEAPLLPRNIINAGNHWHPVVPTYASAANLMLYPVTSPQLNLPATTASGHPSLKHSVQPTILIKAGSESSIPPPEATAFSSVNDGMNIFLDNLPPNFGNLMAAASSVSTKDLHKQVKQQSDEVEAGLEAFSQCIQGTTGITCSRLEVTYWIRWLVIIMALVMSNVSSS